MCDSFNKLDDCYELTMFRDFRDNWLKKQPEGKTLIDEYYAIAPKIVTNINKLANAKKIYQDIWQKYLRPCLVCLEMNDNLACKHKYTNMVNDLKKYL